MVLALLTYALYGLAFTLGKITLSYGSPLFIIGSRMVIGGTLLGTFFYYLQRSSIKPRKEDWLLFVQAVLFGIVVPYSLREWSLQSLPAGKAAFMYTLMPFFTALFAYFFRNKKLTLQKGIGLAVGFGGAIPITLLGKGALGGPLFSSAELGIMISVASFSYYLLILKRLVDEKGYPASLIISFVMFFGGIVCLLCAGIAEPLWIINDTRIFVALLAAQIIISNIICLTLEAHLLTRHSSTLMAFANLSEPIFATFFGWLLLGEHLHLLHLASFMVVCAGLGIFYADEVSNVNTKEDKEHGERLPLES